jgi:hypothetical protein
MTFTPGTRPALNPTEEHFCEVRSSVKTESSREAGTANRAGLRSDPSYSP